MRVLFLIMLLLIMQFSAVYSQKIDKDSIKNSPSAVYIHKKDDYSGVTNDPSIIKKALNLMTSPLAEHSKKAILGNNPTGKPMIVKFKKMSPKYKHFDALGFKEDGRLYIYINSKHKNAPPEAFASLLSHEALHQDEYNSMNEETYAWTTEAKVWLEMKKKNPELNKRYYNKFPLVYRENVLGNMYKSAHNTNKKIRRSVETNPGYSDLPKRSPGFENDH